MKKNHIILSTILVLFVISLNAFSQTYEDDTLAVRAILDSNGLYIFSVENVSDSSGGRIIELKINDRNLTSLPPEVGNLTALEVLDLGNNSLTDIPSEIGNLINLEYLMLDRNNITNLPSEIGNLLNLWVFYLSSNNLTTLPPEMENLTSLGLLTLSSNDFTTIPPELCNITSLARLDLQQNNLSSIDSKIGNLINLVTLNIHTNNLTNIPEEIGNIENLAWINLAGNKLTLLPESFGNLTALEQLDLSENSLTSLPSSIIMIQPTQYCNLDYNKLDTNNLSPEIITWADKYDPNWRETQNVPIIYNPNSVINPKILSLNINNSLIIFNILTSENIKLQIYNMKGRLLSTLVDSYKQAGEHNVNWDSKRSGAGVYYIKLSTGNNTIVRKAIVIK